MTKKHKITKRFLAFALSVAMIVTFTPTSFLAYAENPAKEAAVEEPSAPAEDVVKEEPTESKDDVVKEEAPAKEKEDPVEEVGEATKDTPVSVGIRILQNAPHETYNGEEQSLSYTRAELENQYELHYYVGNSEVRQEDFPQGFEVNVKFYELDSGNRNEVDASNGLVLKGTDAGCYAVDAVPVITGTSPGYYVPDQKWVEHPIQLFIDKRSVTVTVRGTDESVDYDGEDKFVPGGYTVSISDDLYTEDDFHIKLAFATTARNVKRDKEGNVIGYPNGPSKDRFVNDNPNFDVEWNCIPGSFVINPAKLTLTAGSARHIYDEESTKVLTCSDYIAEGFKGDDERFLEGVRTEGGQPYNEIGETQNVITAANWSDYDIADNYDITFKPGTLTVFPKDQVQIDIYGPTLTETFTGQDYTIKGYNFKIDNPIYEKMADLYTHENDKPAFEYKPASGAELKITESDAGKYKMNLKKEDFVSNLTEIDYAGDHFKFTVKFNVINDGVLTINPQPLDVFVSGNRERVTYDGEEHSMQVFAYDGFSGLPEGCQEYDEANIVYKGDPAVVKGTEIGKYRADIDIEKFENKDTNYDVTFLLSRTNRAVLKIGRSLVTVKVVGKDFETEYNGEEQKLNVSSETGEGTVENGQSSPAFEITEIDNPDNVEFDVSSIYLRKDLSVSGKDPGRYVVKNWYRYLANDNQNVEVEFMPIEKKDQMALTITKKKIDLVIDNKTMEYGDKIPKLTAHYEDPETHEVIADGPEFKLGLETEIEAFGEYNIILADELADSKYQINVKPGTLTFERKHLDVTIVGSKNTYAYDGSSHRARGFQLECYDKNGNEYPEYVKGKNNWAFDGDSDGVSVNRTDAGTSYMGLATSMFTNLNDNYDVSFTVDDGYVEIVDAGGPFELPETIEYPSGEYVYTYDGEPHPVPADSNQFTCNGKTYRYEAVVDYKMKGGLASSIAPVKAGDYAVLAHGLRIFNEDDIDVTSLCTNIGTVVPRNGQSVATLVIKSKPIEIKLYGHKARGILYGESVGVTMKAYADGKEYKDYYTDSLSKEWVTYEDGTEMPTTGENNKPNTTLYMDLQAKVDAGKFRNWNNNYDVTFTVAEDGYYQLDSWHYPNFIPVKNGEDIEVTYDGKSHEIRADQLTQVEDGVLTLYSEEGETYTCTSYTIENCNWGPGMVAERTEPGMIWVHAMIRLGNLFDENGADAMGVFTPTNPQACIETESRTLTIKKRTLTVAVKDDISKMYGDPDPDLTTWLEIGGDGLADTDTIYNILNVWRDSGEDVRRDKENIIVGYPIHVEKRFSGGGAVHKKAAKAAAKESYAEAEKGAVSSDPIYTKYYDITIDNTQKYLTIYPLELTVTADDKDKKVGQEDPTLTMTTSKGLIGSESIPEGLITINRDPGETVGRYEIKLGIDGDVAAESNINDDPEWDVAIEDPGISVVAQEAEAAEEYYEEVCKKEVWEYAAKSMKAAKALNAVKSAKAAEKEEATKEEKEAIKEQLPEMAEVLDGLAEYAEEAASGGIAEILGGEADEIGVEPEPIPFDPAVLVPSSEFKAKNYEIKLVNGWLTITDDGTSADPDDPDDSDDPDDPVVTADSGDSGTSGNSGNGSSTGDTFGLMGMIMLLTASLIGLLALVSRRRREQE